jgi:hypothetical protein
MINQTTLSFIVSISYGIFYFFAFFVSLWIGNFLTSFYYRIPRGISLNGRKVPPMCSSCGVKLKYPDYGPLYYYLIKSKTCKVCGVKVPGIYCFIELFVAIILITNFCMNGLNELSVITAFTIACLVLNAMINYTFSQLYVVSVTFMLFCSIIRGVCISTHTEFLYSITISAITGLALSIFISKKLPTNSRFFLVAIACSMQYKTYIVLFAISYALYTLGIFINRFANLQDEFLIKKVQKFTNPITTISIFAILFFVFFDTKIESRFLTQNTPFNVNSLSAF